MGLYAVLREGEIFGMRKEDVDLEAGVLMVCRSWDAPRTKDGKALPIPFTDARRPHLERALRATPGELLFPQPDTANRAGHHAQCVHPGSDYCRTKR